MMSNTGESWNLVGDKVRGDSWFNSTDGIHTVSISYYNFVGGFKLQGTLSLTPQETDWFDIFLEFHGSTYGGALLKYPKTPGSPTGQGAGDTGIDAFTFIGNFTFLRAVLNRDFLGPMPVRQDQISGFGTIDQVLLSL